MMNNTLASIRTVCLFIFLFFGLHAVAQKVPTQAEINKMVKDMEQNPDVKKAMRQAGIKSLDEADINEWNKLPAKKTKLLAALPKTVMTSEALRSYSANINTQVLKAL
jgi:hypothetical protein